MESPLLACPNGITIDEAGVFYVANFANGNVIRVSPSGEAELLATIPGGNNGHLVYHDGRLYVVARREAAIGMLPVDGEVRLHLPLTREAMADYLGLALETVSRQVSALKRDGVLRPEGQRKIVVLDLDLLLAESGDGAASLAAS